MARDFEQYKHRLKKYLSQKGVDVSKSPTRCFNQGGHKNGDANPSLQLWDDGFKCHGCGVAGDIYDAVEILEGITDKGEQYDFIERFFGGAAVSKIAYKPVREKEGEDFKPDGSAMEQFENYLKKNAAAKEQIKKFLCERAAASVAGATAYPEDIEAFMIDQFLYWPGLDDVRKYLGNDVLKKCGVPLINPNTSHSTWEHSGVVMRLGTGYKLHYYLHNYCDNCKQIETCPKSRKGGDCKTCEKRTSKGGKTFPMPGMVDPALPVILVEGEMNALSCAGIGIKNLFSTGGTNGLTAPKVKKYLLNVPEIILFFDADEAGHKASGIKPLDKNDKRKTNIPQTIRRAGYTGKIKLAELPPVAETGYKDQDALIIAGKREIITAAIAAAREWKPSPPPPKKVYALEKFNFLSVKRLNLLLKKLPRKVIDKEDAGQFIAACLRAFPHEETKGLLAGWGAAENELVENSDVSPYFILTVIEKHLSYYIVREIEREITPVDEYIRYITIQDVKFYLNFEEIEISQNARNFYYTGGTHSAALVLADIFDGKIIYNDAKNDKKFYFYDGHVWRHEPHISGMIFNVLFSVLMFFYSKRKKESAPEGGETGDGNKKLHAILNRIEDRRFRRDIEREFAELKAEGVYHNSDDKNDPLHFDGEITRETLTLRDCVYDFSTDKPVFRKSRPEEYRKNVLPYTMSAIKNTGVDNFWKFMRGNFKNEDTLQTFMYYLSLIASRVQYKYGAFLIGGRNTGKSTTMQMIKEIYKHLIGFMDADILVPRDKKFATGHGPTPYIAALEGLGASITMETEDGATLNAAIWKKLTGNDMVPARGLNEAPKEFANTAQIIIASNMLPKFNRHDTAIIDRIIVIPFLVDHDREAGETQKPDDIMKKLQPEYPGIVRVFAEYYIKLKNELHGRIIISKESASYKTDVIAETETDVDKFIDASISFESGKIEAIKDVYQKYLDYHGLDETGVKRGEGLSRIRFTRFVLKNYKEKVFEIIQRIRGGPPARVFVGIRIRTFEEIAAIEEAKKGTGDASTQVPRPAAAPVSGPVEDECPF